MPLLLGRRISLDLPFKAPGFEILGVVASIGIYGTLAYSVAGRETEIGIRMAVGAPRSSVILLVLRDSMLLIAIAILIGLPLALGGTRWIKSFLFGVPAVDPIAIAAAILLILILASLATYSPALRAAGIDPIHALRHESILFQAFRLSTHRRNPARVTCLTIRS